MEFVWKLHVEKTTIEIFACMKKMLEEQGVQLYLFHGSTDEDDYKRIITNVEVQKIRTIFETVQAQVSNLKFRVIKKSMDFPNKWIGQVVMGEIIRCRFKELPINSVLKCMYPVIRFCVVAEKMS